MVLLGFGATVQRSIRAALQIGTRWRQPAITARPAGNYLVSCLFQVLSGLNFVIFCAAAAVSGPRSFS